LEKSARFCPENPYLKIFQKIQIAIFTRKSLFENFSKNPNSAFYAIFGQKKEISYKFTEKEKIIDEKISDCYVLYFARLRSAPDGLRGRRGRGRNVCTRLQKIRGMGASSHRGAFRHRDARRFFLLPDEEKPIAHKVHGHDEP
jgi:hypothetical protein